MYKILFFILTTLSSLLASSLPTSSVVKISASVSAPNYQYPWQTGKIENISGTGIIIESNFILTSAHVITNAKFIQVSKENSTQKYTASLKFVSPQVDLALLEVSDKSFFQGTKALKMTTKAKQGDPITVLGFPIGGTTLSTTKGVISRIEPTQYSLSAETFLTFQIDAAINPGNSGGPAINNQDEIVGIAMQVLTKANNIAYIIPSVIINTFLEDCKDGEVEGFDTTKLEVQHLTNETLRNYYGISGDKGIVVTRLDKNEDVLRLGDIILEIDHQSIYNDSTVKTAYGHLSYSFLFSTKPVGKTLPMLILRDHKPITVHYTLKQRYGVINVEFDAMPRYMIYGGFIFSPLTYNYLATVSYRNLFIEEFFRLSDNAKHVKESVIMQYEMLPHAINAGYKSHAEFVKSVNGIKVIDFEHFVNLIDAVVDPYTIIEFLDDDFKKVILETKKAKESFKDIQKIYGISSDRRL